MTSIPESCTPVNAQALFAAALDEAVETLCHTLSQRLQTLLVALVCQVVGRSHYTRRQQVSYRDQLVGQCCRCGSRQSRRFSRNGFRHRAPLLTQWGVVPLALPRVRCVCGGSVQIDCGDLLRPYQRLGSDIDAQIQRWGHLALSLRQMRRELEQLYIGPLALRTLNQRLQQLRTLDPQREAQDIPPIMQVDAIWVTLLRPNGRKRRDSKGRQRPVKGRFKVPIMIALGVWPDQDRWEILAWRIGTSEGTEEWVAFLEILEAQGLRGENGLKLIIHDGGTGLGAALDIVWFDAEQQRCLFHKLRNIYQAIQVPDDLPPKQRRRRKRAIFKAFHHIWQARHYRTVLRRYRQVVRHYRDSQPKAVATLRRDFRLTVTYYQLEQQCPTWDRKFLRTISLLERFNRYIRRRARAANAYHSEHGLQAMVAQEIHEFHLARRSG